MSDDTPSSENYVLTDHDRPASDHDMIIEIRGQTRSNTAAIKKIQGDIRWALKIVIGAVFVAILSGVVVKQLPAQNQSQTASSNTRTHSERANGGPSGVSLSEQP